MLDANVTAEAKSRTDLAALIGETLILHRQGRFWTAQCPFHGDRTPSFTIYPDQHFHCFGCGAHGDCVDWLIRARGISFPDAVAYLMSAQPVPPQAVRWQRQSGGGKMLAIAHGIWDEAVDAHGTPAETYLRTRGVELPDEPVIRFHPQCPCGTEHLPAMVALMSDPLTGDARGIHRTFLRPDGSGKADIDAPKRMLGTSGVVRLYEPGAAELGIAEGIETALAVAHRIGWRPVWAATCAGNIAHFPPLPHRTLNIFADNDRTGIYAARECAKKWTGAGLEVLIHSPPDNEDWNDASARITP